MAHKKLRQEKNCLNCGHEVQERYCTHCGQENLELKDSAIHLVVHYVQDLFHYDGRFWHSVKLFLTKPGQVQVEYMEGKRVRNLEPVRFYIFASTVFFLLLWLSVGSLDGKVSVNEERKVYARQLHALEQQKALVAGTADTLHVNALIESLRLRTDSSHMRLDSTGSDVEFRLYDSEMEDTTSTGFALWLQNRLLAKSEELRKKHQGDETAALSAYLDELIHKLPQLLFLSLPFFAVLLKLLYWRNRRKLFVDHFVFSIYHYAYMFVVYISLFLVNFLLDRSGKAGEVVRPWITLVYVLYPMLYLPLALKRYYQDTWLKLILRYMALGFLFMMILILLFILVAFAAFLW